MNFRIATSEAGDVRLVALLVEPTEHCIELSSQNETDDGQRESPKFYGLAQDPAENLRGFEIRQFAAGDLQLPPHEVLGTLKGQSHKSPDVVGGDGLIRLVTTDRVPQPTLQDSDFYFKNVVRLHKRSRPENRGSQAELANVLFDLPFAFPMRDAGVALSTSNRAEDKELRTRFLGGVGEVLALLNLTLRSNAPEILDTVNAIGAPTSTVKRKRVFQVSLHNFDPLSRKFRSGKRGPVARQRSQLPALRKHVANDCSALPPGRSSDKHCLVFIGHGSHRPFLDSLRSNGKTSRHTNTTVGNRSVFEQSGFPMLHTTS